MTVTEKLAEIEPTHSFGVLLMLFEYYTVEPPLKATKNLKIEGLIAIIKPQRGLDTSTFLKRIKNKLHAISKS